jgi:hypothetical protein
MLTLTAGAAVAAMGTAGIALTPRPSPAPTPVTRTVPVDRASITVTASSTLAQDGTVTYTAANTLDGNPTTAWNSDGRRDGKGPGIRLSYAFAQPIDLREITVRNGYQKVLRRPGKAPQDLYPLNERVHRLRVVTDAGRWTWNLADTRTPQTFTDVVGRTRSVRLEIVTVYPSKSYPDVALSEVSFMSALPR